MANCEFFNLRNLRARRGDPNFTRWERLERLEQLEPPRSGDFVYCAPCPRSTTFTVSNRIWRSKIGDMYLV